MAKYVRAATLTIGNRINFDSDKVYIVKSVESLAESWHPLCNRMEFRLSLEGDETGFTFPATYYAGDQIKLLAKYENPKLLNS